MYKLCSLSAVLIAVVVLVSCSQTPQIKDNAEVLDKGLIKVSHAHFDSVYIRTDIDFKKFDNIIVEPLNLADLEVTLQRHHGRRVNWTLTDEVRAHFTATYQDAMIDKLRNEGAYSLANSSTAGSAIIKGKLIEIVPYQDQRNSVSRGIRKHSYGSSPGILEIQYQVLDHHGNLLATMQDRREAGNNTGMQYRNIVRNSTDVKRLFRLWADMVKDGFNYAQNQ
mgnify:CR=1 FL=1